MELTDGEFGGKLLSLTEGDSLRKVPRAFGNAISDGVRHIFADPRAHYRGVAKRMTIAKAAQWLSTVADHGTWQLQIFRNSSGELSAGFDWHARGVRSARLGLPAGSAPALLKELYAEMDGVDWMGFGCAGKLEPVACFHTASAYAFDFHPDDPAPDDLIVIGTGPSGDMIVCTRDGRGGWLSLGTHRTYLIGSISETLDWIFGNLLKGETPELDYSMFPDA